MHNLSPLLRNQTSNNWGIYSEDEPWTLEVETWFMKAILSTIFQVRMGAKYHLVDFSKYNFEPEFEKAFIQQWATCGRVLFRDGDYTNINWIGFYTTTAALLLICFISYLIERIHRCRTILFKFLTDPYGTVAKIRSILELPVQYLLCIFCLKAPAVMYQSYLFWEAHSLSNVFRERQTWYGCWHREASGHSSGLDDFNLDSTQINHHNRNDYDLDNLRNLRTLINPFEFHPN